MAAARVLELSPTLQLPVDAVTETFAILGKRGGGKTYTASVLVEEMLKAHLQVVVADPLDVWWGLRAAADSASPTKPYRTTLNLQSRTPLVAFMADQNEPLRTHVVELVMDGMHVAGFEAAEARDGPVATSGAT